MKKEFSVKTIVAVGIGSAVFVILGRFVVIPTGIPNTNLETSYSFLALMAALFGPVAGFLIGFIGHTIKDLTTYGAWWSWIICSGVIGLAYGFITRHLQLEQGEFSKKAMIKFNISQVIVHFIVWAGLAPVLDIAIYSEPANKVFTQGVVAATVNSVAVALIGTILMKIYASSRTKKGSLTKE
ncbi:ECF-type riboflavin transporter substrate-binding protein [Vagococcus salmoninarum]|uniref:ECF-type riboflavin transporter substrate-binding protein n=1 Tax=Vagococcus salmoninarum TaxID=2739 RepID=UPI003F9B9477